MNSGVADAHNLAWKLAFVLRGDAEPTLLDTYTAERAPVAHANADFSVENLRRGETIAAALRSGDEAALRAAWLELENQVVHRGTSMGYSYEDGAVIPDGTPPPPRDARNYWPSDRPGARFPHRWLDVGKKRTTLDWFQEEFVLVCGPMATAWRGRPRRWRPRTGAPWWPGACRFCGGRSRSRARGRAGAARRVRGVAAGAARRRPGGRPRRRAGGAAARVT